jgi:perosamine synthetase
MREIPPTAGLPLEWRDLLPVRSTVALTERLASLLGIEDLQVTCSGTAALVIALSTLAAESERREVVVPAYTCPLVALAVAHCGMTLRICDLQSDGMGMDPAKLASLCGPDTLAIVPTYLGGRVLDIQGVLACAASAGAAVIEDAAQAMGARHADGTPVGMRGDIGFYSMAVGKGLTMYEGGVLLSRHPQLRAKLRDMANAIVPRQLSWELRRSVELLGYAAFYRPHGLSLVYGAPLRRALSRNDPEAAAGDLLPAKIALHRVGAWRQSVAARAATRWLDYHAVLRSQAQRRKALLNAIAAIDVIDDTSGAQGVWPVLMVRMPDGVARDAVLAELWGAGVGVGVPFARALPDYPSLHDIVPAADVPNARAFAARVLTITNSPWLDNLAFARIVASIERACHGHETFERRSVTSRMSATTQD